MAAATGKMMLGRAMPVVPFLEGLKLDAETKRVIGVAYELTRIALGLEEPSGDFANEAIAKKIIELAEAGEQNPDLLCERALAHFRERALYNQLDHLRQRTT